MGRWVGFLLGALLGAGSTGLGALGLFFLKHGPKQALWGVLMAAMLGFGAGGGAGTALVTLVERWRAGAGAQGGGALQGVVKASHGVGLAVLGIRAFLGVAVVVGILIAEVFLAAGL